MRDFWRNMQYRMMRFMQGRYGNDRLNHDLSVGALIFMILGILFGRAFSTIGFAMLLWCYFRMLSRNRQARYQENLLYMQKTEGLRRWFQQKKVQFSLRDTYRYYHCPMCRQQVRVPKGRGKIQITCPKCKYQFIKKS